MGMRKLVWAVLGTVCVAFSAVAAEYTWTGGGTDAGVWTDPANWGVASGYPQAGDVAVFSQNATITGDFSLGGTDGTDARLVITTTVSSVELAIEGVISGEGGLRKTGAGILRLYAANTFKGDFELQGVNFSTSGDADSSPVYIYDGKALGQGKVWIDPDRRTTSGNHGRIYLCGTAGATMTVPNEIDIGNCDKPERGKLYFKDGNYVMEGDITAVTRAYMSGSSSCESVRFKGSWSGGSYFHMPYFGANTILYFDGGVACTTFYSYSCNAKEIHFKSPPPSGGMQALNAYRPIVFDGENALGSELRSFSLASSAACFNLNGYDQIVPKIGTSTPSPTGPTSQAPSTSRRPCRFAMRRTTATTSVARLQARPVSS